MQTAFVKHIMQVIVILGALPAILASCASAPAPTLLVTPEERIQRDQAMGVEHARQFEVQLKLRQDTEVLVYLRKLAQSLGDATPELRSSNVGVFVVQDRGGRWRDFGFPGNRIYLSQGLLKGVAFENELAAAMAVELGHILKRHALNRIQEEGSRGHKNVTAGSAVDPAPVNADYPALEGLLPASSRTGRAGIDYLSPTGIFAFPDEFYLLAFESAVDVLYRAGFDPRGLLSLLNRYETEIQHSPYDSELLAKLLEKTRRAIALRTPLRNPIVRSQSFLMIQKRMQKL